MNVKSIFFYYVDALFYKNAFDIIFYYHKIGIKRENILKKCRGLQNKDTNKKEHMLS